MKLIRIFLVVLVALTMFAWVAQEDVRDTDETFSRCEMLQGWSQQQALNQRTASVIEISSFTRRYKNINMASVEVSTPHLTMLSLVSCILRC